MKDNIEPCLMDTIIVPRERNTIYQHPESYLWSQRSVYLMENKMESLKNALDNIRQICENENIKPKMKLTFVGTIAGLALGLTNDDGRS